MNPIVAVLLGLLGLIIGSFLNVCIYRLPRRQSVNWPGSRCTTCDRSLSWYENIPVVSWLVLRGRCRTCGERISAMYPLVELVTGVLFLACFLIYGLTPMLAVRLAFACAMVVLFAIDLTLPAAERHYRAWHRGGFSGESADAARLEVVADRPGGRRRCVVPDSRGLLPTAWR